MNDDLTELMDIIVAQTLDDLFSDHVHPVDRMAFIDTPSTNLGAYHTLLGRQIRNMYGLWNNDSLAMAGIHPDEFSMSCIRKVHSLAGKRFRESLVRLK